MSSNTIYQLYWIHTKDQSDPLFEGYIGVTKDIHQRLDLHKKSDYIVGRALRKYSDIRVDILKSNISESEAYSLELSYRPTENIGWNIAAGGRGSVGNLIPSSKTRQRMSLSQKERHKKYGAPCSGKTWKRSAEANRKISDVLKAKYDNGYVNNRKGIKLSDDHKRKQRLAALNRTKDYICEGCEREFTIQGLMSHTRHKDCNGYRFTPPTS